MERAHRVGITARDPRQSAERLVGIRRGRGAGEQVLTGEPGVGLELGQKRLRLAQPAEAEPGEEGEGAGSFARGHA